MSIKAILFDLDGTLLPMDLKTFQITSGRLFAEKMAVYGYEPEQLMRASWEATMAMSDNDGSVLNEALYFGKMLELYGEGIRADFPHFKAFYENEFDRVKEVCGFDPQAGETVRTLKEAGYRLVMATNAWFPESAIRARLRWAGVDADLFEFMTLMDNSHYCKPNLSYYEEILQKLSLPAEECLMVGNDVQEDMVAEKLGLQVFLMTDQLIHRTSEDISRYSQGSFDELLAYVLR